MNLSLSSPPFTAPATVSRSIGAILIDAGLLDPVAAEQVIKLQKEEGLRFGDAAVKLGLLTEADIQQALASQYDYPFLQPGNESVSEEVVAAFKPFSPVVEQLRVLRSQLMLRWFDELGRKMLTISSPDAEEGRSFIAANLAVVFSQLGERTLLLDADLRQPRQHELFKLGNRPGLSAVLSGRLGLDEGIVKIPGLMGLSVLPAGAIPPNPQELLNRPAFIEMLGQLQQRFDVILVDTSRAAASADAVNVASRVGASILVARKDMSIAARLKRVAVDLQHSGVQVIGTVLNNA